MHIDELHAHLHDLAATAPAADPIAGRRATYRRVRRQRQQRVAAIAATAAVVILLVAAVGRLGRAATDEVPVISGPASTAHLIPGALPPDLIPRFVGDLPMPADAAQPIPLESRTVLFTQGSGPDGGPGGAFIVTIVRYAPADMANATISPSGYDGLRVSLGRRVDGFVEVASRTLTQAERQHIADAVGASTAPDPIDATPAPGGYLRQAAGYTVDPFAVNYALTSLSANGSLLVFGGSAGAPAGRGPTLSIAVVHGSPADIDVLRTVLVDDTPTLIHGQDGIAATIETGAVSTPTGPTTGVGTAPGPTSAPTTVPAPRGQVLAWLESDATVVIMVATGMTADELRALAETLQPVDAEGWRRYVTTTTVDGRRAAHARGTIGGTGEGSSIAVPTTEPAAGH